MFLYLYLYCVNILIFVFIFVLVRFSICISKISLFDEEKINIVIIIFKIQYLYGGQRTSVCVGQASMEPVVCDKRRGGALRITFPRSPR